MVGTAGVTVLCVPRLVTCIAGSARMHGATHSVRDLRHGDRDLEAPHLPRAHPGVPAIPAPHCHPALAIERNLHGLRVTNISTYTSPSLQNFSQRKCLSRKAQPRRFLQKPQLCDGFKRNSKATNTTTVGRACQSARCCCWKNCSAAMGLGLCCHRRERGRDQELWAPAPLVQKEKI